MRELRRNSILERGLQISKSSETDGHYIRLVISQVRVRKNALIQLLGKSLLRGALFKNASVRSIETHEQFHFILPWVLFINSSEALRRGFESSFGCHFLPLHFSLLLIQIYNR